MNSRGSTAESRPHHSPCRTVLSHTDFVGGTFCLIIESGSRMRRQFREGQPDAGGPPSLRDWLPEDHRVYFLRDVTGQVDLSPIVADYGGENGGQPPSGIASEVR